ncbi:MAG: Uma2 family endonuclease [Synechococcaceae cyanobacterium SM2_3_1]|nr:Uma2 family endonuclease [Synechococcaceae cyanobacterium SM2_3_1]
MSQATPAKIRWTRRAVEALTQSEGTRYEIIDGELFVTRSPHRRHQQAGGNVYQELNLWSEATGLGEAIPTPGLIFSESDTVIPDVVWVSTARLAAIEDEAGHLTAAPELVIEVLSPGTHNEARDREIKLRLYSVTGVQEYWILNRFLQQVEVYRRMANELTLVVTLANSDALTSPLLPGFSCAVSRLFR